MRVIRRRGGRFGLLATIVGLLVTLGVVEPAQAQDGGSATRVMLVGDSITHGSAGDWTWRYRLWRHLEQSASSPVDFVGPSTDLWEHSTAYVDAGFDTDHAARWGNALTVPSHPAASLAADHRPDVAVVLLGVLDLTWQEKTPREVAELMRRFVADLRAGSPGVDVVITRIPVTGFAGVSQTNELFVDLAQELDTSQERVVVAWADQGFVQSTPGDVQDTYDLAHPSARGELKIAAAVADALATIGVGAPHPRPLPTLALGPRVGAVLSVGRGDESATLSWHSADGTTGEVVWVKDLTAGTRWKAVTDVVEGSSYLLAGLRNKHRYKVRLRPVKGWAKAVDTRSNVVEFVPRAPKPRVPKKVRVSPRLRAAKVRWAPVTVATRYVVRYREAGRSSWRRVKTGDTAVRVDRLRSGHRYVFRVRAVDDGTRGRFSPRARVRVR